MIAVMPGVGRAQHVASGFERARLRNLQVLLRRDRAPEPRDVAHVHEQRRLRQLADDFCAEGVLVADVDGDALPRDRERLLGTAPRAKSSSGICTTSKNHPNSGFSGMNSPKGTRCDLR